METTTSNLNENDRPRFVDDHKNDIAMNDNGVRMYVDYPGRQLYQKVYVYPSKQGKAPSQTYVQGEASAEWRPAIRTTEEELKVTPEKLEMMVVGLVLLDKYTTYSASGNGLKSIQKADEKEQRGVLPRSERTSRAFVQITDYIGRNVTYFVGVEPTHGVHEVKKILAQSVFFYQEFWPEGIENVPAKKRPSMFSSMCKQAAAKNKGRREIPSILVGKANDKNWRSAKGIKVSNIENLVNVVSLQVNLWQMTRQPAILQAIEMTLAKFAPDLKDKPKSGGEDINTFCNANAAFTNSECEMMLTELKSFDQDFPDLDGPLVVKIRHSLDVHGLIPNIPRHALPCFLKMACGYLDTNDDMLVIDHHVKMCVDHVNIAVRSLHSRSANAMTILNEDGSTALVRAIMELLKGWSKYLRDHADAVSKQHGGVDQYASIEDLMERIAATVDRDSFVLRVQELLAIHAHQIAGKHFAFTEMVDETVKLLENALA